MAGENRSVAETIERWNAAVYDAASFGILCTSEPCIKDKVVNLYKQNYPVDGAPEPVPSITRTKFLKSIIENLDTRFDNYKLSNRQQNLNDFEADVDNDVRGAAAWVWRTKGSSYVRNTIFSSCANSNYATQQANNLKTSKDAEKLVKADTNLKRPFDRRLDRLETSVTGNNDDQQQNIRYVPFSSDFAELSTTGYLISQDTLRKKLKADKSANEKDIRDKVKAEYDQMANNEFYKGVPALQNYYALVRLFGSDGGKYLVNQKDKRRWYEVDNSPQQTWNFTSTPTTSALISWGLGDPYGRTPYQFTDFVFSKYWNKIANNRLITLRRYAAPILDNLKFPGMISQQNPQNDKQSDVQLDDLGSIKSEGIPFPPMATAVTYFGGESGNSLNNILKFTTGVLWEDIQAAVWEVNTDSVPDNKSGPGKIFGSISKFAEMLNVAGGSFDRALIMNNGQLPPDPYTNGPYENRIWGPLNRIDSVKKRKPGLAFEWDGLSLVFEYVARPVGNINPKAVLLDIMSNFLVMGSASAVFFGGAHRFMANPAKYPFIGGQEGIERWYKGDPIGWGLTTIKQFTQGGASTEGSPKSAASNIFKNIEGFFSQLFSGEKGNILGAVSSLLTGGLGNIMNNEIAKKTAGQVPYLHNMKAILTGEPVGEWHVTVGNPLNPIAMIGNLICEGITVEFNEELGPDDFPTEMKVTVKLKHAMGRDRDAIESIFNRGMGRIYNLPDSMSGSADFQTVVDNATAGPRKNVGYMPDRRMGIMYRKGMDSGFIPQSEVVGRPNPMGGETSIWSRASFNIGISENSATQFISNENDLFLSSYRAADWIAARALT